MTDWQRRFPPRKPWQADIDDLAGGKMESVVAGSHISVDNTDPQNPVLAVTGVSLAGYPEGTAFPLAPANNDKFYRTDLDLLCVYKSAISKWLTVNEYSINLGTWQDGSFITASNTTFGRSSIRKDVGIYLARLCNRSRVQSPVNSTNYWTVQLRAHAATTATVQLIGSYDTKTNTADQYNDHSAAINDVLDATVMGFFLNAVKTGAPGSYTGNHTLYYRLIVT